jgi:hypothetical protein
VRWSGRRRGREAIGSSLFWGFVFSIIEICGIAVFGRGRALFHDLECYGVDEK